MFYLLKSITTEQQWLEKTKTRGNARPLPRYCFTIGFMRCSWSQEKLFPKYFYLVLLEIFLIILLYHSDISAPWAARRIRPGTDEQATPPGADASPARAGPADVELLAQVRWPGSSSLGHRLSLPTPLQWRRRRRRLASLSLRGDDSQARRVSVPD